MKEIFNKIVDIPKLVIRFWIVLWLTLFIFVIAKLCFNVWYPIVVENQFIIKVCDYIDNNKILNYIILLFLYLLNANIIFLTMIKRKKFSKIIYFIVFNILQVGSYIAKYYYNFLGIIIEILFVVFAIIINLRRKTFIFYSSKRKFVKTFNFVIPIFVYLLLNIWQLNILFIRDISSIISDLPSLIYIALQIDYYIFLIITWIGVNYIMGLAGWGWLWSKSVTQLKALKQEELQKQNPNFKLLEQIEKAIADKENATEN